MSELSNIRLFLKTLNMMYEDLSRIELSIARVRDEKSKEILLKEVLILKDASKKLKAHYESVISRQVK